jgi:hypothetical protein
MGRRKIRNEIEARACIAKVGESGLTPAKWARSMGIDGRSLHAWTVNLARGLSGCRALVPTVRRSRRAKLVELVPTTALSHQARYVVRVGQLAIEVDDHFDDFTLRRLVGVLRSC